MDTVRTATYINDREKDRSPSPNRSAANDPPSLPGNTAFGAPRLPRMIEDSLSDLTEAVSPLPSVTPDTEKTMLTGSVQRHRRTLSQ
jgi:hypothetical protein